MRILDLFCGGGGASVGYVRAGHTVIGVDIKKQKNYPYEFVQDDALRFLGSVVWSDFDAIHASPPCQLFTNAASFMKRQDHIDLILPTRELLLQLEIPYIIENVVGARKHLRNPIQLCGSSVGLLDLQRHRLFETNWGLEGLPCRHDLRGEARFPGSHRTDGTHRISRIVNPMGKGVTHAMFATAMGVDWIPDWGRKRPTRDLCEMIPPAYTEYIGNELNILLS